jgi:DNA-binding NarL/FixJ family response regulator
MVDRMSVLSCDAHGGLLAVNLYRHEHQGCYSNADCRAFQQIAGPVLAAVRRHVKLTAAPSPAVQEGRFESWLLRHCPALPAREKEVCVRLLLGMSYDGIASDLGLSVSTVKTYRMRAFERMGIHFRSELFSLYAGQYA